MQNRDFLQRYRLSLGRHGLPVELHRTPAGTTYRAHEIATGREVAIELVPWTRTDSAADEQLQAVATSARQINHPGFPALHDFGIEEEQLVYVTDSFEGHSAEAWVAARGPLPLGAVLRVALQVVSALGAANYHRVHHRAINPANIIFIPGQTAEGDWPAVKVLHWFGPAADVFAAEGKDARADTAVRFASPEQLRGGTVDFASAVFSLGCTMWFLLTGTPPMVRGAEQIRARVSTLRGVPKIVRHLLGRMLRVDPLERPLDPVALQAYLQTCLTRVERLQARRNRWGFVPAAPLPVAAVKKTPREWPVKALAIAALLLLFVTLAAVAVPRWMRSRNTRNVALNQPPQPNEGVIESAAPAEGPNEFVDEPTPTIAVTQFDSLSPNELAGAAAAAAQSPESAVAQSEESAPDAPAVPVTATRSSESAVAQNEESKPNELAAKPSPTMAVIQTDNSSPDELDIPPSPSAAPTVAIAQAKETTALEPALVPQSETVPDVVQVAPTSPMPVAQAEVAAAAPQVATSTPMEPEALKTEATPRPKPTTLAARSTATRKKTTRHPPTTVAKVSNRSVRHSHTKVAGNQVRRARKIPTLRVNSHPAELVGTTSDGRWILSVASSGERLIVPPPPGYSR
ncbi:MAG: protein kinase domain-containing protein [Chthoniobacterales bacterium]